MSDPCAVLCQLICGFIAVLLVIGGAGITLVAVGANKLDDDRAAGVGMLSGGCILLAIDTLLITFVCFACCYPEYYKKIKDRLCGPSAPRIP